MNLVLVGISPLPRVLRLYPDCHVSLLPLGHWCQPWGGRVGGRRWALLRRQGPRGVSSAPAHETHGQGAGVGHNGQCARNGVQGAKGPEQPHMGHGRDAHGRGRGRGRGSVRGREAEVRGNTHTNVTSEEANEEETETEHITSNNNNFVILC